MISQAVKMDSDNNRIQRMYRIVLQFGSDFHSPLIPSDLFVCQSLNKIVLSPITRAVGIGLGIFYQSFQFIAEEFGASYYVAKGVSVGLRSGWNYVKNYPMSYVRHPIFTPLATHSIFLVIV